MQNKPRSNITNIILIIVVLIMMGGIIFIATKLSTTKIIQKEQAAGKPVVSMDIGCTVRQDARTPGSNVTCTAEAIFHPRGDNPFNLQNCLICATRPGPDTPPDIKSQYDKCLAGNGMNETCTANAESGWSCNIHVEIECGGVQVDQGPGDCDCETDAEYISPQQCYECAPPTETPTSVPPTITPTPPQVTPTPTSPVTPSVTPIPTPTPTNTSGPTPTPTRVPGCMSDCQTNAQCGAEYPVCDPDAGACRKNCPTGQVFVWDDCVCITTTTPTVPIPTRTPTPTITLTPPPGSTPTPTPTITPTPPPGSTNTPTPKPTEIVIAQVTSTPAPTLVAKQSVPEAGTPERTILLMIIPVMILLLGLLF